MLSDEQAVAEFGQAQVKDEVVVKVRGWSYWWRWSSTTSLGGGGWSDKTKVILNSNQFKLKLKLELSLVIFHIYMQKIWGG